MFWQISLEIPWLCPFLSVFASNNKFWWGCISKSGWVGGSHSDYKTNLGSQLNLHWTCQLELSLAKVLGLHIVFWWSRYVAFSCFTLLDIRKFKKLCLCHALTFFNTNIFVTNIINNNIFAIQELSRVRHF